MAVAGQKVALMTEAGWPTALIGILAAALGVLGTIVCAVLIHVRDLRRIKNEGRQIEGQEKDAHYERLIAEVARLDGRVAAMERDLVACHEHKNLLEMELTRLRLQMIERGNNRQIAQLVASQTHLENDEAGGGRRGFKETPRVSGIDPSSE